MTPRELAEAVADYADTFLTQKARVLKAASEQNVAGSAVTAYPASGPIIPCRISTPKSQREGVQGEQVQATSDMVIELPLGTVIGPADRIAVGEDRFLRDGSLLRCTIYRVSGPSDDGRADALVLGVPVVRVI